MIIGYILWGPDNGSEMFSDLDTLTEAKKCSDCGFRVDYRETNNLFRIKRKVYDFSFTYDSIAISSLKFKEFCNRNNYGNIRFMELERSSGFYQFILQNSTIPFTAREVADLCGSCGQHEIVVGPHVDLGQLETPLEDGFYQSNILYGGRGRLHDRPLTPVIVVAPDTKEKIQKVGFKNMVFEAIVKKNDLTTTPIAH
ncbi:hypothetical protein [Rufibacter tibetensis]|uniref:Uncharacterized protein n=1 Tax=Rufibacter tibetensis TaxID=512763 RepID=A0A0P0CX38_9BACT|nr:hypothetical protein [Rufibacter tibetensis]ALI99949.1 hypothetical protein DC20_14430 [Rufibacter tibetensis]